MAGVEGCTRVSKGRCEAGGRESVVDRRRHGEKTRWFRATPVDLRRSGHVGASCGQTRGDKATGSCQQRLRLHRYEPNGVHGGSHEGRLVRCAERFLEGANTRERERFADPRHTSTVRPGFHAHAQRMRPPSETVSHPTATRVEAFFPGAGLESIPPSREETPWSGGWRERGTKGASGAMAAKRARREPTAREKIDLAAREGDAEAAMEAHDEACARGETLPTHACNVVLHLCAKVESQGDADGKDASWWRSKAQSVFQGMEEKGIQRSEVTYTSMARLAAAVGDAKGAAEVAEQARAAQCGVRLRTYAPALHAFCVQGDFECAMEVMESIKAAGLTPTQKEYAALLQTCTAKGRRPDGQKLLQEMKTSLEEVHEDTAMVLRRWFETDARPWKVEQDEVDAKGTLRKCQRQLRASDLTEEERKAFAEGIAKVACERETKPNDFLQFKEWLEKQGPYKYVVDGANVGMFGQNFHGSRFQFRQIERVVQEIKRTEPEGSKPPLVVLHVRRVRNQEAEKKPNKAFLQRCRASGGLYATPGGSNDDWYWLYAAVLAHDGGYLVSNDEMRDHVFQLLGPEYFSRWKDRHQLRFQFNSEGLELKYPPPFSRCIQQLEDGSWHFPLQDSERWLCACPEG